MLHLPTQLRLLSTPVMSQEIEVRRRFYLAPKIFFNLYRNTADYSKAVEAYSQLISISKNKGQDLYLLVADFLEDSTNVDLPIFLLEEWPAFYSVIEYVAYGNADMERGLPQDQYDKAKEYAVGEVGKYLNKTIKFEESNKDNKKLRHQL